MIQHPPPVVRGLVVFLWVAVECLAAAQESERPGRFATGTEAVVVDVAVRDANGQPVKGLSPSAFSVFEDGRRQRIISFDAPDAPVTAAEAARAGPGAGNTEGPPPGKGNEPDVVALVFEQLSIGSLQLSIRAARDLVGSRDAAGFTGLFTIDRALQVVTAYTNARPALDEGFDVIARRAGQPRRRAGYVPGAEFGTAQSGVPTRETKDDVPFARGLATIDALSAIVEGLRPLPGRKLVILFSEGLALDPPEDEPVLRRSDGPDPMSDSWLTDSRHQKFVSFLERANAARVVFYTFDAAGLRTESPFASLAFGRAPYVGLQFLAEQTGGAFVENTNDLGPGVRRAWSDTRHAYVLGYVPSKAPDNSYRTIRVSVDCKGCTVLARKGYRATTRRGLGQVGDRDVAALLFLERGVAATDLPAKMDVLLSTDGAKRVTKLSAEVGFDSPAGGDAAGDSPGLLTVLARVRGDGQRTIAVLSQHFDLAATPNPDGPRRVVFSRSLDLPPGRYEVDLIAYVHRTGRATIYSKNLLVPKP